MESVSPSPVTTMIVEAVPHAHVHLLPWISDGKLALLILVAIIIQAIVSRVLSKHDQFEELGTVGVFIFLVIVETILLVIISVIGALIVFIIHNW